MINLLQDVQREFGIGFLFIAHDLAVVRHFCPEVAVMYLGKIVEIADRETLYHRPHHPYTQALLSAVPDVKQAAHRRPSRADPARGRRAQPDHAALGLPVPHPLLLAQEICAKVEPPLLQIGPRHKVACHFAGELGQHPEGRSRPRCSVSTTPARRTRAPARPPTSATTPGYSDTWFDLERRTMARPDRSRRRSSTSLSGVDDGLFEPPAPGAAAAAR